MIQAIRQPVLDKQTITVGLGEVAISQDPGVSLACFGLGSCICICVQETVKGISGMAHVVLPESRGAGTDRTATKYADIAVPYLLDEFAGLGGYESNLVIKLVGGAQMIRSIDHNDAFEMGARNLEMITRLLTERGLRISGSDTGGSFGRSVWMFVDSGKVLVRKAGEEPHEI